MADIRIKDLATTASTTASDDFLAVDGTTNGTRKLSAATPSFATSVTVPSVVGPTSTDLTLTGGSTGASLVLGAVAAPDAIVTLRTAGLFGISGGAPTFRFNDTTNGNFAFIGNANDLVSGTAGFLAIRAENGLYLSAAGNAQQALLTSTGNLLIGTTTDAASLAGGLVVNGSGAGAAASSTTTGALRVTGGVGVSGAGYFGGNVVSNSGSNPIFSAAISGTSIGSFSAFGADVYIGVDQNANGNMIFRRNSATESMRIAGSNGAVNITSTVSASTATTGALTIGNGSAATNVAIGGGLIRAGTYILAPSMYTSTAYFSSANGQDWATRTNSSTSAFELVDWNTTQTRLKIATAGQLDFYNAAGSTSLLSITNTGAATLAGAINLSASGQANAKQIITNTDSASYAHFNLVSGVSQTATLYQFGSTYTTAGRYIQGSAVLETGGAGGLNLATSAATPLRFYTNGDNLRMTVASAGDVSINSSSPSTGVGSGALQVAGGIYAGAASVFEGKVSSNARFHASSSGGGFWAGAADLTLGFYDAAGSMVFRTSGINQLTLAATTGAATFAGVVRVADGTEAAPSLSFGNYTTTGLWTADGTNLRVSVGGVRRFLLSNDSTIYGEGNAASLRLASTGTITLAPTGGTALTLAPTTLAATFAGAVSIGNTVAVAAAVASTHKVTMVIGGVTYYLLATNV